MRSYAAVVSFICVIVVVITSLALVWSLLGLIAPGVYLTGARTGDLPFASRRGDSVGGFHVGLRDAPVSGGSPLGPDMRNEYLIEESLW